MGIFYVNGEYVAEEDAKISVRDLSVLRGYGAFDYLRTYGGQPFRLKKNIARLRRSCEIIEIDFPWSDDELYDIVMETLRRNEGLSDEFSIRLVVTGGISSDNITPDGETSLVVLVQALKPYPQAYYDQGVKVITVDAERLYPDSKTIVYTPAILAQKKARAAGGVEAIYKAGDGIILEGTTCNIFLINGNRLITHPLNGDILPGVTRLTTLEVAEDHYDIEIRPFSYDELIHAEEVFLTSANKQVVAVHTVDEHTIGDGKPGEGTRHLMALFAEATKRRAAGMEV